MPAKTLPVRLLTLAAAWLLAASGASLAATPAAAVPDDLLAPLAAAYVRAVKPGEQVDAYRELFGTREADRAHALPGADEPAPPKARVEQSRCAPPKSGEDQALACALAFLKAGAIETFLAALGSGELPAPP